jgi:sulfur relay (sulfurtransferase) DsrF/TusC family protein
MKKTVIVSAKPTYGSALNAEGFRAALGLAFSELDVDLILMCDGVYSALKTQAPQEIDMKSLAKAYVGAGDLNIKLFLDKDSVENWDLDPADLVEAPLLSGGELKA